MDIGNQVALSTSVNQKAERDDVKSPTVHSDEMAGGKNVRDAASPGAKTNSESLHNIPKGPAQRWPQSLFKLGTQAMRSESAQPRLQQIQKETIHPLGQTKIIWSRNRPWFITHAASQFSAMKGCDVALPR